MGTDLGDGSGCGSFLQTEATRLLAAARQAQAHPPQVSAVPTPTLHHGAYGRGTEAAPPPAEPLQGGGSGAEGILAGRNGSDTLTLTLDPRALDTRFNQNHQHEQSLLRTGSRQLSVESPGTGAASALPALPQWGYSSP